MPPTLSAATFSTEQRRLYDLVVHLQSSVYDLHYREWQLQSMNELTENESEQLEQIQELKLPQLERTLTHHWAKLLATAAPSPTVSPLPSPSVPLLSSPPSAAVRAPSQQPPSSAAPTDAAPGELPPASLGASPAALPGSSPPPPLDTLESPGDVFSELGTALLNDELELPDLPDDASPAALLDSALDNALPCATPPTSTVCDVPPAALLDAALDAVLPAAPPDG